jgi:vancomycin resistance protein YoaR
MSDAQQPGTGTTRPRGRNVFLGIGGGLLAASLGLGAAYFVVSGHGSQASAATVAEGSGAAARDPALTSLEAAVAARLGGDVAIHVGQATKQVRWSDLGAVVDTDDLPFALERAGKAPDPVAALRAAGALPIRIDRDAAIAELTALKGSLDRAPESARMDLEARTIVEDKPGSGLDLFGSVVALEAAARTGADEVTLPMVPLPARVTRASLGIDDISHVLGTWTTHFSVSDKTRNYNLKLAASKLNGHVLAPHAPFSFNDVVGERTEKEGYKIAHVIQAGEMVDGLAGGTCQISTTLFAASFFAGLEVDHASPHSRPSAYQPIGFDATVVYPVTDLKLTNPYDFPVVIHYRVASGEAQVEILGKKRPWDKVMFEREIEEETPFTQQERTDPEMPLGTQVIDQAGFDGYKIKRFRKFYNHGHLVKTQHWTVTYKPVTEYLRTGTSLDPFAAAPEQKTIHHLRAPKPGSHGRITQ